MDTTQSVSATSLAAAAAAGVRAEDEAVAQGDAFALLLRSLGNRFDGSANPLDANTIRNEKTRPEPKPVEAREDRRADREDKKADGADKAKDSDKTKAADRGETKDDSTNTDAKAGETGTDAQTQVADAQAAQLAAIQAQLIANTNAPVVQTVQTQTVVTEVAAVVATPVVDAVDPNAQVAVQAEVAEQTGPVSEAVAQVVDAKGPQASEKAVKAITEIAPEQAKADLRSAVVTQATTKNGPDTLALVQDTATDDMPVLPQANQIRAQSSAQTPGAQAQSEALSRLLGGENQIKIAVNVENAKPATPSLSPYNPYVGYSMGNAAETLANGGLSTTEVVATAEESAEPQAEAPRTTLPAPAATTAAFAALVAGQTGPAAPSAHVAAAPSETPAITGVAHSQNAGTHGESAHGGPGQGQGSQTNATNQTNAANGTEAAKQAPQTAQIFDQIKVHITRATKAGLDQVTIQLRPDDLGRVEVKLEVAQDGKVHAMVIVDKPETLALMQNDARGLERALNDAGLRTDANALEFSLRGDGSQHAGTAQNGRNGGNGNAGAAGTEADEAPSYDYSRAAAMRGGVDTYA